MRRIVRRPSPAMVVAFIALLLALGGTATALRGSNTVFKDDIRRNAVGRSEILTNGVGKSEVRTNGVGKSEILADAVGQSELIDGAVGATALKGFDTNTTSITVPGGNEGNGTYESRVLTASCDGGDVAIAGSAFWNVEADNKEFSLIRQRYLLTDGVPTGFQARGGNDSGTNRTFTVEVHCLQG
jgi:hypothetical protein